MRLMWLFAFICLALSISQNASANAFVRGAYYRLGDDDPGAVAGAVGNDPTFDSFSDHLDLSRFGSPHYAADVPPNGPIPNKLSMAFANISLGGPGVVGYYGRTPPLNMIEEGYALEAWVKAPSSPAVDPGPTGQLIAYNGDPTANGFGFYRDAASYVARIGAFEQILGPATDNAWHHLAYIRSFSNESYYFDGKLVRDTTSDPIPTPATNSFWLGGRSTVTGNADLFNGWIDEVRYQSFNPAAAGAFDPTGFLISVPEPGTLSILIVATSILCNRRRRGD